MTAESEYAPTAEERRIFSRKDPNWIRWYGDYFQRTYGDYGEMLKGLIWQHAWEDETRGGDDEC